MAVDLERVHEYSLVYKAGDKKWSTPMPVQGSAFDISIITEADKEASAKQRVKDLAEVIRPQTLAAITGISRTVYRNIAISSAESNVTGLKSLRMSFLVISPSGLSDTVQVRIPEFDLSASGYATEHDVAAAILPHIKVFGEDDKVTYLG